MKLAIICRTLYATNIIEYLNSYGEAVKYDYTQPDYFGTNEVTVFIVEGSIFEPDGNVRDLTTIYNYIRINPYYSSNDVVALKTEEGMVWGPQDTAPESSEK